MEVAYERGTLDYSVYRHLCAAAGVYSSQNGNFHMNEKLLPGGRQGQKDRYRN
jgi:hypothetical protein